MTLQSFIQSLANEEPPTGFSDQLLSLWYEGKGNWNRSHQLIQDLEDSTAAWIHAYLHRKEGDNWNADYWYNKAGRKSPSLTLQQEWESIVSELLQ
jgi:hypothetical protein